MLGADRISAPTTAVTTGRDLPQRSGWARRDQLINAALAALFSRDLVAAGTEKYIKKTLFFLPPAQHIQTFTANLNI